MKTILYIIIGMLGVVGALGCSGDGSGDDSDAGAGDTVLVVQEGSSARKIFNDPKIPVQAVVVGIVESVNLGE